MADRDLDDDSTFLTFLAAGVLAFGWIPLVAFLDPVRVWMLDRGVLVPAHEATVVIPGWDSGLDLPRLALLALVVLFLMVIAVSGVRRWRSRS